MDVQEALDEIGGCRRWHVFAFLLINIGSHVPSAIQMFGIVFIGWAPPHYCKGQFQHLAFNGSLYEHQQCYEPVNLSITNTSNSMQPCNDGWTFDSNGYSTLITEFVLVCDKDYYVEISIFITTLVGTAACLLGSYITDRFGRKNVHLISFLITAAFGIVTTFSHNFWTFVILKCITAAAVTVSQKSGTTLMFEIFGPKTRTLPGIGQQFIWSIAILIPCLLGFVCKDWRIFQLVGSAAPLVLLPGYWFMFESPTWLYAKKRYKETDIIIEKIIKLNGLKNSDINITLCKDDDKDVKIPIKTETDSGLNNTIEEKKEDIGNNKLNRIKQSNNTVSVPLKDLCYDSKLRRHLFLCMFFLFVGELVYVGLTLSSASFGSDRFINFLLFGLIEFPATALALWIVVKFGRKIPQLVFFISAGIPLLIIGILPQTQAYETVILVLAVVAKFGIQSVFCVMDVYIKELFPTTLRGSGSAWSSLGGRLGSAMSPAAAYLAKKIFWLPMVMFGIVSILAGIAVIPLPETSGKPLPQTTEDVHVIFYSGKKRETLNDSISLPGDVKSTKVV